MKKFEEFLNEQLENVPRINTEVLDLLNKQIAHELFSSQLYRKMAVWCDNNGWMGGNSMFFAAADEELYHMKKIYCYISLKNSSAIVPTIGPTPDFTDIKQVIETALEHEMSVTAQWELIAETCKRVGDNDCYSFAQEFLKEQRDEEEKFRNILYKMNLEMPKWKLDAYFTEVA